MHLIQIFLPLYDNVGQPFPKEYYRCIRDELIERHGGLTAYTRSPAHGLWQPEEGTATQDELVIYEVMVPQLDTAEWHNYRSKLEKTFRQDVILMRAHAIQML
jgi:hypothetical protein